MTTGWVTVEECDIKDFAALVETEVDQADYPFAAAVVHGAIVYDSAALRQQLVGGNRLSVMSEIARALLDGPGVVAFRGAFDPAIVAQATATFNELIEYEKEAHIGGGDHFAKPGANDRVWNALEKFALRDPATFVDYYANDILALVSHAWLGTGYQVTSQINVVNPGGEAQEPHRDYHLGFMTEEQAERYPAHVHRLSPALTLQGAVAHCDMPLESGPTRYLPHSQKYESGYVAWRRPDFKAYFAQHHMQLELQAGDAVFFNPALFHAAGSNVTPDVRRMANLLQVSSAFGRAMEDIGRRAMIAAVYPWLLQRQERGVDAGLLRHAIAATAEGYAFPGDLDQDRPLDGLAPESDAVIVQRALAEKWPAEQLAETLTT